MSYYREHKERMGTQRKAWYDNNPDNRKAVQKRASAKWYANHREEALKRSADWKRTNPDKVRAQEQRAYSENGFVHPRTTRKQKAYMEHITRREVYRLWEGDCAICLRPVDSDHFHVDHRIPLARGGLHSYLNVQLAHPECNSRKHTKPMGLNP